MRGQRRTPSHFEDEWSCAVLEKGASRKVGKLYCSLLKLPQNYCFSSSDFLVGSLLFSTNHMAVVVNTVLYPILVGGCTTHCLPYLSGWIESDVHYETLTHGQMAVAQETGAQNGLPWQVETWTKTCHLLWSARTAEPPFEG